MGCFLSTWSGFFFILAEGRSCPWSFWFLMLYGICCIYYTARQKMPSKENPPLPQKPFKWNHASDEILKQRPDFEPCIKVSTGSHVQWVLLAVYPLALFFSLHFYHLWSSHGQRTPGFISTKVLLLWIANPRPACSNNFPTPSPPCFSHPLSVSVFVGSESMGQQGEKESRCTG